MSRKQSHLTRFLNITGVALPCTICASHLPSHGRIPSTALESQTASESLLSFQLPTARVQLPVATQPPSSSLSTVDIGRDNCVPCRTASLSQSPALTGASPGSLRTVRHRSSRYDHRPSILPCPGLTQSTPSLVLRRISPQRIFPWAPGDRLSPAKGCLSSFPVAPIPHPSPETYVGEAVLLARHITQNAAPKHVRLDPRGPNIHKRSLVQSLQRPRLPSRTSLTDFSQLDRR
ncbi:hypothetical protein F5X68DRAFT_45038 [Plectosphaerella plurivora]|uniref:Uncharacterized protein n=1 Tax=Plectosphaerella plurivora TaxID=936078 RepID=A0A9P9AEH4_9PEZI|nr:hypothetical protein F5X68DRAFT_45038 [Plectosphaerella plurivora]